MPKSCCVTRCPKVCRGVASDAEITSRLRIAGKSQNSDTQHAVSRSIVQSLNRCFYCQNISKKLSRLIKTQFNEELEAVLDRLYFVIPRDWQMVSDGTKKHCWKEQNFWMRQLRPVSSLLTMLTSLDLGRIRHFWSEEGWSIVDTRLLQCGNKQQKHDKTRQNKVTWWRFKVSRY